MKVIIIYIKQAYELYNKIDFKVDIINYFVITFVIDDCIIISK